MRSRTKLYSFRHLGSARYIPDLPPTAPPHKPCSCLNLYLGEANVGSEPSPPYLTSAAAVSSFPGCMPRAAIEFIMVLSSILHYYALHLLRSIRHYLLAALIDPKDLIKP